MQLRDRADNEIKEVDRQMSALEERKFYLEGQLAQIKPNTPMIVGRGENGSWMPSERLRSLQAQYASLSGVYSASHPDVIKMRREIEALKKETGGDGRLGRAKRSSSSGYGRTWRTARDKYSDDHPDVTKLKKSIAALEAEH